MKNDPKVGYGLSPATLEKIITVFAQNERIEKAILYGSRAKGNYRNGSDIDLTLIGEKLTYRDLAEIENNLDDLFLPYTFDLSLFKHIENPDLIDHIHRVGLVFYQS